MTPEEQKAALDRFLKDLNGKVDQATFDQTKAILGDPTKPEAQSLITAITTGMQNGYMAQSDYARKSQELADRNRQVEAIQKEYLTKAEALETYKEYLGQNAVSASEYQEVQAQMNLLQTQNSQFANQLKELGLENDEVNKRMTTPNNQNPANPNSPNPNQPAPKAPESPIRYFSVDQYQQAAEQQVRGTLMEAARVSQMAADHFNLTGQSLDLPALTQEALDKGKLPFDYWSEKFEIPKLRAAKATEAMNAQIEAKANEIAAKKISEARMTGVSANLGNSRNHPIYDVAVPAERQPGQKDVKFEQGMYSADAVQKAVEEYEAIMNTGKLTDGMTVQQANMVYR